MPCVPGPWLRLDPATVAALPAAPGIFELATLVRNVVRVERAGGDLRRRVGDVLGEIAHVRATTGGHYVRVTLAENEEAALAERLAEFRAHHGGRLPPGHGPRPSAVRLVARRAA